MKPRYQIRWYAQLANGMAGGTMHFEYLADAVGYWSGMSMEQASEWNRELKHVSGRVIMNESNNGGHHDS